MLHNQAYLCIQSSILSIYFIQVISSSSTCAASDSKPYPSTLPPKPAVPKPQKDLASTSDKTAQKPTDSNLPRYLAAISDKNIQKKITVEDSGVAASVSSSQNSESGVHGSAIEPGSTIASSESNCSIIKKDATDTNMETHNQVPSSIETGDFSMAAVDQNHMSFTELLHSSEGQSHGQHENQGQSLIEGQSQCQFAGQTQEFSQSIGCAVLVPHAM